GEIAFGFILHSEGAPVYDSLYRLACPRFAATSTPFPLLPFLGLPAVCKCEARSKLLLYNSHVPNKNSASRSGLILRTPGGHAGLCRLREAERSQLANP